MDHYLHGVVRAGQMDRDNSQEKQDLKIHAAFLQSHLEVTQCVISLATVARVRFQCGQCDAFDGGGVALDGLHARPTPMQQRLVGKHGREGNGMTLIGHAIMHFAP